MKCEAGRLGAEEIISKHFHCYRCFLFNNRYFNSNPAPEGAELNIVGGVHLSDELEPIKLIHCSLQAALCSAIVQ